MPFRVRAHETEIEVLGTDFNVNTYEDEGITKTTLLNGGICIRKGSQINKGVSTQIIDPAGYYLILKEDGKTYDMVVASDAKAWIR
jgi:transmembrane sensor